MPAKTIYRMKKTLIVLSFIALIAFIVFGYKQLIQQPTPETNIDLPIPLESTEVILFLNDIDYLTSKGSKQNIFIQTLNRVFNWNDFLNTFQLAAQAWRGYSPNFYLLLQGNGHDTDWLLVGKLNKANNGLLPPNFSRQWTIKDTLTYQSNKIIELHYKKLKRFFVPKEEIILIGSSRLAVENYLRFSEAKPAVSPPELQRLFATIDTTATANVLVNYQQVHHTFADIFKKNAFSSMLNTWGAYDINLTAKSVYLTGVTSAEQQTVFKSGQQNGQAQGLLPNNLISFEQYCLPSTQLTAENFCNNNSLLLFAKKNLTGRVLKAQLYEPTLKSKITPLQIIETHNGENTRTALQQYIGQANRITDTLKLAQEELILYHLPKKLGQCLGNDQATEQLWATWKNQLLVGSKLAIKQAFRSTATERNLHTNTNFNAFVEKLPKESNYWFYLNPSMVRIWSEKYLSDKVLDKVKEVNKVWNNFSGLSVQVEQKQHYYYTHLYSNKSVKQPHETNLASWATRLDSSFSSKPTFVWNHLTNTNDIVIQDLANTLYWIDSDGVILWKRNLGEKIKGKIHHIDFYKNNKYQLLFSTTNKLFMVDRLGRDVENYPISLPYPTTNGLAVFDYENNKDYRLIIACLDKRVYAFDQSGTRIKGWEFRKTETEVEGEIQHIRIANKDYIILSDNSRNYILNRKGQERIHIREQFVRLPQNPMFFDLNPAEQRPFFISTDSRGILHKVYLNGAVQTSEAGQWSNNHFFVYQDFDGDGLSDYIFLDNKTLRVQNRIQKTLLEYHFPQQVFSAPGFYSFSQKNKKIGVFSQKEQKVYLFNNDGKQEKGFPIDAQSPSSIGRFNPENSVFNILVGRQEQYLFHYKLDN